MKTGVTLSSNQVEGFYLVQVVQEEQGNVAVLEETTFSYGQDWHEAYHEASTFAVRRLRQVLDAEYALKVWKKAP